MFQSLNAVVVAIVLLSNGLAALTSPAPRQVGPVGTLHPTASSKKCVDVRANARANGTAVQVFDCNDTPAQNWNIQQGSTKVQLNGTDVCLDAGSRPANGVKMKIWKCFDGLAAQQWNYIDDNHLILQGTDFCLDLTDGGLANSNQLQIWTCSKGNKNQVWREGPPGNGTSTPLPPLLPSVDTLHPTASSKKCIDVRGNGRANGIAVQVFDCNDTPAQNWKVQRGSTKVQLNGTDVCLDAGSNPANGVKMKIWKCFDGLAAQQWKYNDDNQLVLQGTDFCLDLTDGGLTNSNQLQIWTCSKGNKNQVWREGPPGNGSSTPPPPPKGRPLHRNGNSSKCVDVKGAIFANGTPVQIFDCNGSNAQNWILNDGNTKVQLAGTDFCLDATSGTPASGTKMKIWKCFDNLPAQTWTYSSSHTLKLQSANECLDLTNGVTTNSNQLQVWQCFQGNTNQVWTV